MKKLLTLITLAIACVSLTAADVQQQIQELENKLDMLDSCTPVFIKGTYLLSKKGYRVTIKDSLRYEAYPRKGNTVYVDHKAYQAVQTCTPDELQDYYNNQIDKLKAKIEKTSAKISRLYNGNSSRSAKAIDNLQERKSEYSDEISDLRSEYSKYKNNLYKYNNKISSAKTKLKSKISILQQQNGIKSNSDDYVADLF